MPGGKPASNQAMRYAVATCFESHIISLLTFKFLEAWYRSCVCMTTVLLHHISIHKLLYYCSRLSALLEHCTSDPVLSQCPCTTVIRLRYCAAQSKLLHHCTVLLLLDNTTIGPSLPQCRTAGPILLTRCSAAPLSCICTTAEPLQCACTGCQCCEV